MTKNTLSVMMLSALAGFLLGIVLYRPGFVRAQGNGGLVKVKEIPPSGSVMLYTGQVVGFSCNESHCYVASIE